MCIVVSPASIIIDLLDGKHDVNTHMCFVHSKDLHLYVLNAKAIY